MAARNQSIWNRGMDGRNRFTGRFERFSDSTFETDSIWSDVIQPGQKITWLEDGTTKNRAYIVSTSVVGSDLRVNITGNILNSGSDYSQVYITNGLSFTDHSDWITYSPTLVGWSSSPTNARYEYCLRGRTCHVMVRQGGVGTSNSATTTISLPDNITVTSDPNYVLAGYSSVTDNGATKAGRWVVIDGDNKIIFNASLTGANFASSGSKRIQTAWVAFRYET